MLDRIGKSKILKKPSSIIAISGYLNALQRKFYNGLLYMATEILKSNPREDWFLVDFAELRGFFLLGDYKNYEHIKKAIQELMSIKVEYNLLNKDKNTNIEGVSPLIFDVEFERSKSGNIKIRYSIPRRIRESLLKKNGIYALLDLMIIKGLRSKYAILLYELIRDYKGAEIPIMEIEQFRKLFGIEDKYSYVRDIKRRVLEPAIAEINDNENIDVLVSYILKKQQKRKYTHIKFLVKPKPVKMKLEQQKTELLQQEAQENPDLQELLLLLPIELRNMKVTQILLGALQEKDKNYIQAQIQYCLSVKEKKGITNFSGYLKKALENDYAGVEVVEVKAPKKEKNINDYIEKWFVVNNIGYCIIEITKEENKISVVAEEKGTGVKKLFKFKDLETLRSYMY